MSAAERVAVGFVSAERTRRACVPGASVIDLDGLALLFANVTDQELNSVLVDGEPVDAHSALVAAEAEFERRELSFGIDLQVDRHAGIDQAVRDLGMSLLFERPAMVVAPNELPDPHTPTSIKITPVSEESHAQAVARVDAEAFEGDLETSERFYAPASLASLDAISLVAWDGDEPVGSAAGYLHDGAVGVFGVAVVPHARGRGVGGALTIEAARAFPDADLVWLHPSDAARSMYDRLGFRAVSNWQVWARGG
jgi:ribosomal protein S18 acetylase RimI-like enzyme